MAKELPYFKFEPAEYLTKDISFCSLSAQGLFINICSYYWQRNCKLTKSQLLKRLNYPKELDELIIEGALDLVDEFIIIKFLDVQLSEVEEKSKTNSTNGSKGGRPKKNPTETEIKPKLNPIESESKGIREEEIRLKEIKEYNNTIDQRKLKFAKSLLPFLDQYGKELLREFCDYWTEHGDNDKKMRFEKQSTFGLSRRLSTWNKNNFKNKGNGKSTITDTEEFNNIVTAIRSTGERR